MENLAENEKKIIVDFVKKYREKFHIEPTLGFKQELSGEAYGEGYLILFRQLVTTIDGYGSWQELEDPQIRQLVIDEINKSLEKGVLD